MSHTQMDRTQLPRCRCCWFPGLEDFVLYFLLSYCIFFGHTHEQKERFCENITFAIFRMQEYFTDGCWGEKSSVRNMLKSHGFNYSTKPPSGRLHNTGTFLGENQSIHTVADRKGEGARDAYPHTLSCKNSHKKRLLNPPLFSMIQKMYITSRQD